MTQAPVSRFTSGLLLAAAGSIAFSGKAIIVKLAYRHGVDGVTLLMFRMLFAVPFFLAMAWWAGRGQAALTRRDWWGVVGLGFSGYYIGAGLGPGPRDGLMVGLAKRGINIGKARTGVEIAVLLAGVALGGSIGVGTIAFAVLIGTIVAKTLPLLQIRSTK